MPCAQAVWARTSSRRYGVRKRPSPKEVARGTRHTLMSATFTFSSAVVSGCTFGVLSSDGPAHPIQTGGPRSRQPRFLLRGWHPDEPRAQCRKDDRRTSTRSIHGA